MHMFYVLEILTNGRLPFIKSAYPSHHFQQVNDPKHTSHLARTFMEENDINWWKTPPESKKNWWTEFPDSGMRE